MLKISPLKIWILGTLLSAILKEIDWKKKIMQADFLEKNYQNSQKIHNFRKWIDDYTSLDTYLNSLKNLNSGEVDAFSLQKK